MAQALGVDSTAVVSALPASADVIDILSLSWDSANWSFGLEVGAPLLLVLILLVVIVFGARWLIHAKRGAPMEIDQAELGIGDAKLTFRPNLTDRQVAYAIWVELSTRKIGLSIDLEDDVISEIYDSWYNYFSVTRELIKTISVSRVRNSSTRQIINLSIDVLNNGLRPHLTKWQARYRDWYDRKVNNIYEKTSESVVLDPQAVQKQFPKYDELSSELLSVNKQLIAYRTSMQSLVFDKR